MNIIALRSPGSLSALAALAAGFIFLGTEAKAVDYTWSATGTSQTPWTTPGNWTSTGGTYPGAGSGDNVVGSPAASAAPASAVVDISINNLTSGAGAWTIQNTTSNLAGQTDFIVGGTISPNGTSSGALTFRGNLNVTVGTLSGGIETGGATVGTGDVLSFGAQANGYTPIVNLQVYGETVIGGAAGGTSSVNYNVINSYDAGLLTFTGANNRVVSLAQPAYNKSGIPASSTDTADYTGTPVPTAPYATPITSITATVSGLNDSAVTGGTTTIRGAQNNSATAGLTATPIATTLNIDVATGSSYSTAAILQDRNTAEALTLGSTLAVTKSGAGTQTLRGASTYSGGTTVLNGVLIAANTTALGTGDVTVSGGTLSLNEASTQALTLGSGADLTMATGVLALTILSPASFDTIAGSGGGVFSLTGGLLDLTGSTLAAGTYQLLSGFASGNTTGLGYTGYNNSLFSVSLDSTGLLTVTAVPEPSTVSLLLGAGALVLAGAARRRRA